MKRFRVQKYKLFRKYYLTNKTILNIQDQFLENLNHLSNNYNSNYDQRRIDKQIFGLNKDRFSDGTVFCETSDDLSNNQLQNVRIKVKNFHREATPYSKPEISTIRQIENKSFGIFYKINSYVVFTVILENGYPVKLVNLFLDTIINSFFDEAKTLLGSHDLQSRLESIQGSHYFIKFDRIIKQKKRQFDDPKSMKNIERMKRQLQTIQDIMKENMNLLNQRQRDLEETQQKARRVVDESKKFERSTNKLKWNLWFKKNLIWIVLVVTIVILGWVFI